MFIAFEGCDGAGKTTLVNAVYQRLIGHHPVVVKTREPGGTVTGNLLRTLTHSAGLEPEERLRLFTVDRMVHLREVVRPALARGYTVLCDRYVDSTRAYQASMGLDSELIEREITEATDGLIPDLTVLLDLDATTRLVRLSERESTDIFEARDLGFHAAVRRRYLELACAEPSRYLVLESSRSVVDLAQVVVEEIEDRRAGG